MAKKAIIIGASGLIGSNLLQILLDRDDYDSVLILVRKELPVKHKKLTQLVVDFDKLDNYANEITGEVIFSCLGTTQGQTPDKAVYRKIDHDYPVKLAQLGLKNGVNQFHLVSVVGADAKASAIYLKLKGETEEDLKKVGLPALHIYQPSMLTGRKEKVRFLESLINGLMIVVNPLLIGGLKKYHSIAASDVAKAIYNQSIDNETGTFIYQYNDIKQNT
ncbi:MAG: NAD(P)H-binding protein [Bacteroidota bacterium]